MRINFDKKVAYISFFITIIAILPFLSSKIYSIDDYHLLNLYNINWDTMGYNFYSTGRLVEGILAELLYFFNVQPVNKPVGAIFFACSMIMLATILTDFLKINDFLEKLLFVLFLALNPFLVELYYYGTNTIYCSFAVLFLILGFVYSLFYINYRKIKYLLIACLGYICSLGTYQIFYPIIAFVLVISWLWENKRSKKSIYILFCIYFICFILFYIGLKILFFLKPPSLVYEGIDIIQFFRDLFNKQYWIIIWEKIQTFLLENNIFHSGSVLKIILFVSIIGFLKDLVCRKRTVCITICSYIYIVVGLYLVFGLGIIRPNEVSARTLTAFGIYEAGLFYALFSSSFSSNAWKKVVVTIAIICVTINGMMFGRNALNTMRLNEIEMNLANRIVARMESFEEFSGDATLVIYGTPFTGQIGETNLGDYNIPASAAFSKVFLFNEATGYSFKMPTDSQYTIASNYINSMSTWPGENSVIYKDGMFIVRLYY